MSYPKLIFDIERLRKNIDIVGKVTHDAGCSMMIVTKSICADPNITKMIDRHPLVDFLADSRVRNLQKMNDLTKPKVLLRIPQESELEEMVRYADISFQSEPSVLIKTDEEAARQGKVHKAVLMVDLGDLREGIFFQNEDSIIEVAKLVVDAANLELYGIATNLTCYGAIIPNEDSLSILTDIAGRIESELDIKLSMVSGGNSSSYYLAEKNRLPEGIDNLRLGEAFILGNETAYGERIEGTYGNGVILEAQIVELKTKPSLPIGESGMDAFGNRPVYEDRGIIKRAIVAIGQQDTDPESVTPTDPRIDILGASSDHMILDVTGSHRNYRVGDILSFTLGYGGLLKATTSEYVTKEYK